MSTEIREPGIMSGSVVKGTLGLNPIKLYLTGGVVEYFGKVPPETEEVVLVAREKYDLMRMKADELDVWNRMSPSDIQTDAQKQAERAKCILEIAMRFLRENWIMDCPFKQAEQFYDAWKSKYYPSESGEKS